MKSWLLSVGLVVLTGYGLASWWYEVRTERWEYPYGRNDYFTPACQTCLWDDLCVYAELHEGRLPAGGPTPEASLGLLFGRVASPAELGGKTIPHDVVIDTMKRDGRLGPDSCGWHYVEGLTLNDDRRLAVLWDKVSGLGPFGCRTAGGGRTVIFIGGEEKVVPDAEWDSFLAEQDRLLRSRDEYAISAKPILETQIRLPSGELITRRYDVSYRMKVEYIGGSPLPSDWWSREQRVWTGSPRDSLGFDAHHDWWGDTTVFPGWFRCGRHRFRDGTTARLILSFPDKGLRSRPVEVTFANGKAAPAKVTFEIQFSRAAAISKFQWEPDGCLNAVTFTVRLS